MKKVFLPYVVMGPGSASLSRFFRAQLSPDGDGGGAELTEEQKKAKALEEVKSVAKASVEKLLPSLINEGLTSEQAKKAIETIVGEAFKATKIKDFDGTEKTVESIVAEMQKQHDDLSKFVEQFRNQTVSGEKAQLEKFLKDNHTEIKSLFAAGKGHVTFVPKAVGTITTAQGVNTLPPNITGTQQAPLTNVNLREIPVIQLTNNLNTDLAAYPYTEAIPGEGDADLVAEGAAKPQIDFDWETNYAKPYKVAAWIKLTEEAVQDVRGLQDVAENYLKKKHDLKKARLVLYGTGLSGQPTGATVYGRAFVAGSMALQVRFTNFMDVVNAAVTDVATTHNYTDEMPYMANLVLVNPIDFFLNLVSAKDERGLPLYPQASLFNRVVIGGITILPEESIPAGKIFVGDMNAYNTTNYMPYTVKIGWVNDDFIKNQFVILGESRFHAFVKKLDQRAFLYDDIATIKTAITAPEEVAA